MAALRAKSRALTGFLHVCLQDALPDDAEIVTPSNAEERGCQLSVRLAGDARARFERLAPRGVIADFRPPDLVRLAPVPLYSTFADCLRAAHALRDA
jgi:kynureninase